MEMTIGTLHGCARCGQTHHNIVFKRLTIPAYDGEWTHWAPCPSTDEPIMLGVLDDSADVDASVGATT